MHELWIILAAGGLVTICLGIGAAREDNVRAFPEHPGEGRAWAVIGATAIAISLLLTFVIVRWYIPVMYAATGLVLAFAVHRLTHYPYGRKNNHPLYESTRNPRRSGLRKSNRQLTTR